MDDNQIATINAETIKREEEERARILKLRTAQMKKAEMKRIRAQHNAEKTFKVLEMAVEQPIIFSFGDSIETIKTDVSYEFQGFVDAGCRYKISVTRYDESHEKTTLFLEVDGARTKIDFSSKLFNENDPFIVERHFVAPKSGRIIYSTCFLSNKQFLQSYPTLDCFVQACQTMELTRGGLPILDCQNEYSIQCNMLDSLKVSVNLYTIE